MTWIYFFAQGRADGGAEVKHLVGGKGASLAEMTKAGLQVPPGFTIATECCDLFYKNGERWPEGLRDQVHAALRRLEEITGRTFGRGADPLLVAVRSGAAQSMPGMMDTILNVGLNPGCVREQGQRTGNRRGAWEAYYHFLVMFLKTAAGVGEDEIDHVMRRFLQQIGRDVEEGGELEADELEILCARLAELHRHFAGRDFPVDPWAQLEEAITAVFRSWHNERAVTYRRHHHVEGLLGTAVNVQAMCPSEVSGILFTANPVNPALEQMILESSYGLGEAIVLGKVQPDRFVLSKRDLHILERDITRKDTIIATLAHDGKEQHRPRDAASLTDEQVHALAQLGLRVEAYFGHPCDIEWGLSGGEFYLLQARAIKAVAARDAAPSPPAPLPGEERGADAHAEIEKVRQEEIAALRAKAEPGGTVWSRFNLYEILPEPTPMTWAIVKQFMSGRGGFGQMYRDLGFDPDPALDDEGIFDLVCGRPYCNLSREPRMQYRSLPFEHKFDTLKANPGKALYPQAVFNPARAGWKFWLTIPVIFFRLWRSSTRVKQLSRTFARDFSERIVPQFLKEVESAAAEDLTRLSNAEVLERLNHWIRRTLFDFARDSLKPTALAAIAMGNLERVLAQRFAAGKDPASGLKQAQARLRELSMNVRPTPDSDLPGALRELASGELSRGSFLRAFGHRGPQEMELARPRWQEDPAALDALATQYQPEALTREKASLASAADSSAAGSDMLAAIAVEARLSELEKTAIRAEVETLTSYLALREGAKHYLMRGYALIRRCLVELDRRFDLDGSIFFLTPEELPILLQSDAGGRARLTELIRARRRRREIALSLTVPQVIFSDDLEALGRELSVSHAAQLQGVPLSAGVAEGPALVLLEPKAAPPDERDYILVCPSTDPAWLPLFIKARALVMETGGVLSHGAIVAREFGLPAVAGIPDVHRQFKTGQHLRVDGATGQVTIIR